MSNFPPEIIDLLERLSFYNTVQAGQKICFNLKKMVPGTFGLNSIQRWIYAEGSDDLIIKTRTLLSDCDRILKLSNYKKFRSHIFIELEIMKSSLSRLIQTYNDDYNIKSKLSVCFTELFGIFEEINEEDCLKMEKLKEKTLSFNPGSWKSVSPGSVGKIIYPPPPLPYKKNNELEENSIQKIEKTLEFCEKNDTCSCEGRNSKDYNVTNCSALYNNSENKKLSSLDSDNWENEKKINTYIHSETDEVKNSNEFFYKKSNPIDILKKNA